MECRRCLLFYPGNACVCVKTYAQVSTLQATHMHAHKPETLMIGHQYYAYRQQEVTICEATGSHNMWL